MDAGKPESTSRLMLAATTRSSGLQDGTPCVQERLPNQHQGGRQRPKNGLQGAGPRCCLLTDLLPPSPQQGRKAVAQGLWAPGERAQLLPHSSARLASAFF